MVALVTHFANYYFAFITTFATLFACFTVTTFPLESLYQLSVQRWLIAFSVN